MQEVEEKEPMFVYVTFHLANRLVHQSNENESIQIDPLPIKFREDQTYACWPD